MRTPLRDEITPLPWEQPGWLDQASAWMYASLAQNGWRNPGPVEVLHQRPWSCFARVVTEQGTAYFKAPAPPYFEAPLTQALAHWRPDCTVPLLAVDLEHGWLLSAEAGVTLRSLGQTVEQVEHWVKILPLYAQLQIEMAAHMAELHQLGIPDRRLAGFPHLYARLLEDTENLRIGLDPGLQKEEHTRLLGLSSQVADWCAQLAIYGLPETLTHEEVHDANVLVSADRYIFTDWSDSSLAHPFFSILVALRAASHWLKLPENGPEMSRLLDSYLEPWTGFATREKLWEACRLAYQLGMVNRALSWQQAIGSLSQTHKEAYADSVPGWLQDFLNEKFPF